MSARTIADGQQEASVLYFLDLCDPGGKEVALKPGAPVDVTVSADPKDTVEKSDKRQ